MTPAALLTDGFERVRESVHGVLDGLGDDDLAHRVAPGANSIAWLVWHLTRVQDDHVAEVAGLQQVWIARDFVSGFDLPLEPDDIGYGHTAEQVGTVRAGADLLREYHDATHRQTLAYVGGLAPEDLDRVVDERWDPPVTLGVRLVSVINDDTQHVGQAAYLRGLLGR